MRVLQLSGVAWPLLVMLTTACVSEHGKAISEAPAELEPVGKLDLGGAVLLVQSGGLEELLSDPRDAGLRRVLALLDERLLELPAELGGDELPPGTLEFLRDAFSSPWRLRVDLDGQGPLPVRAEWLFQAGSPEGPPRSRLASRRWFRCSECPLRHRSYGPMLSVVTTPGGSLFHGTTDGETSFLLAWGEPREDARESGSTGLPAGVRPALALGVDIGAILEAAERALETTPAESQELWRQLEWFGLGGEAPPRFTLAIGHGSERAHIASRHENWTPLAEKAGSVATGPIPRAALELVPEDATLVSISRGEPMMLQRYLDLAAKDAPDVLPQLQAALGIELAPDLLEPLGQTFGFYLSDSTGGNDLLSAVLFLAVDDEVRLAATLDVLAARCNEFARSEAGGRMRIRPFEHGTSSTSQVSPCLSVRRSRSPLVTCSSRPRHRGSRQLSIGRGKAREG